MGHCVPPFEIIEEILLKRYSLWLPRVQFAVVFLLVNGIHAPFLQDGRMRNKLFFGLIHDPGKPGITPEMFC